jgi:hypothetical protein
MNKQEAKQLKNRRVKDTFYRDEGILLYVGNKYGHVGFDNGKREGRLLSMLEPVDRITKDRKGNIIKKGDRILVEYTGGQLFGTVEEKDNELGIYIKNSESGKLMWSSLEVLKKSYKLSLWEKAKC